MNERAIARRRTLSGWLSREASFPFRYHTQGVLAPYVGGDGSGSSETAAPSLRGSDAPKFTPLPKSRITA